MYRNTKCNLKRYANQVSFRLFLCSALCFPIRRRDIHELISLVGKLMILLYRFIIVSVKVNAFWIYFNKSISYLLDCLITFLVYFIEFSFIEAFSINEFFFPSRHMIK